MAFGKVVQFKKNSSSTLDEISITFDNPITEGNGLLAFHFTGANLSQGIITSGWPSAQLQITNSVDVDDSSVTIKIAGASEPTTITGKGNGVDNTECSIMVMEIEGPFDGTPIDINFAGARQTGSNTYNVDPSSFPIQDIEMAFAFIIERTSTGATNNQWDNRFNQFQMGANAGTKCCSMSLREVSSDSTNLATTVTMSAANNCVGGMLTLKAHSSVVAPPVYGSGLWTEIATPADNNTIEDVVPDPTNSSDYAGSAGYVSIIGAWCGAILRQTGSILEYIIPLSGGHTDYYGNEHYTLDLTSPTPAWVRDSDPTELLADLSLGDTDGVDATGRPLARHTYMYLTYNPDTDEVVIFGMRAGAGNPPPGGVVVQSLDYTSSKSTWINGVRTNYPGSGGGSRYHAVYIGDNKFLIIDVNGSYYHVYDDLTDTYTQIPHTGLSTSIQGGQGLWDSKRGRYVTFGYNATNVQLFNPYIGGGEVQVTTNVPAGVNMNAFTLGGVYHSYIDKYVFWQGGEDLFILDPVTWDWSTMTLPTQTVTPTAPSSNGTYNRLQYIQPNTTYPEGAIIIVNSVDESTYLFAVQSEGDSITLDADIPSLSLSASDYVIRQASINAIIASFTSSLSANRTKQILSNFSIPAPSLQVSKNNIHQANLSHSIAPVQLSLTSNLIKNATVTSSIPALALALSGTTRIDSSLNVSIPSLSLNIDTNNIHLQSFSGSIPALTTFINLGASFIQSFQGAISAMGISLQTSVTTVNFIQASISAVRFDGSTQGTSAGTVQVSIPVMRLNIDKSVIKKMALTLGISPLSSALTSGPLATVNLSGALNIAGFSVSLLGESEQVSGNLIIIGAPMILPVTGVGQIILPTNRTVLEKIRINLANRLREIKKANGYFSNVNEIFLQPTHHEKRKNYVSMDIYWNNHVYRNNVEEQHRSGAYVHDDTLIIDAYVYSKEDVPGEQDRIIASMEKWLGSNFKMPTPENVPTIFNSMFDDAVRFGIDSNKPNGGVTFRLNVRFDTPLNDPTVLI